MERILTSGRECLLVGEGNFSFAKSLCQKLENPALVTATCYESEDLVRSVSGVNELLDTLISSGVKVLFNVDATSINSCEQLQSKTFDTIFFNFPHHKGKSNMRRNRELLKGFFTSCSKSLSDDGHVLVTLCNGQGGTPADNPQRDWGNSWQIVSMATYGGFILTHTEPFDPSVWTFYQNTGFRAQNKSFNMSGAVVHIFIKSIPIAKTAKYTLSQWIDQHFQKDLLEDERHPLSWTKQTFLNCLSSYVLKNPKKKSGMNSPTESNAIQERTIETNLSPCHTYSNNNCCLHLLEEKLVSSGMNMVYDIKKIHQPVKPSPYSYSVMHYIISAVRKCTSLPSLPAFRDLISQLLESMCEVEFISSAITLNAEPTHKYWDMLNPICRSCRSSKHADAVFLSTFKFDNKDLIIGEICQEAANANTFFFVVCLDLLSMLQFNMTDIRLLWSDDDRIYSKFASEREKFVETAFEGQLGKLRYPLLSIHQPAFTHDVSVRIDEGTHFDVSRFYSHVPMVTQNLVREMSEIDQYVDRDGDVSRCFRLVYQSCDRALSKETARDVQLELRSQMEKELGVTLR